MSEIDPLFLACLAAHLDAENGHHLDDVMATYVPAPRVTINGQVFSGANEVRSFHERFGFGGNGAFSDIAVSERRRHSSGQVVVIEQTLSGVHTGKWQGVQPTRKRFEIAVCTIYTFSSEGKLASEDVYFDSSLIYRQLGLSEFPNLRSSGPPPASPELQR